MSEFSANWLALREPIDHAARSEEIVSALRHYFLKDWKLVITDIGSGTGSTIRALRPVMSQELTWHLVDYDDSLLNEAKNYAENDHVIFSKLDLSQVLVPIFEPKPDLITTSAFLDLVSLDWLSNFVTEITKRKIPFYAALTYDGRAHCSPVHEDDGLVLSAFNKHQQTDKGFGPALGPAAADTAIELFEEAGYTICSAESDWNADAEQNEFQRQLLDGWQQAAKEMLPTEAAKFGRWIEDRHSWIDKSQNTVSVGHKDFLAVPT